MRSGWRASAPSTSPARKAANSSSHLVEKGSEQEEVNKEWINNLMERAQVLTGDAKSVLNKVTSPIEDGLAAAMQRLGVPTRSEIIKLTHRVEELTKLVAQSRAAGQTKPKPRARAARA